MMRVTLAAVAVLSVSLPLGAQDASVEARWKLAAGDVLTYEHVIEQNFKLTNADSSVSYSQKIEATERLEVERTTGAGNYQVRLTVTRTRVTVDGRVVFDSEAPEKSDAAAAAAFKTAMGVAQTFVMTPTGRTATGERRSLQDRAQQSFGGGSDAAPVDALPMAVLALPLPEGPLGREGTWTATGEEEMSGIKMISKSAYRFDGQSSGGRAVRGETSLILENSPPTMKLREGAGRQKAVFDTSAGVLRESELDFTVSIENELQGKAIKVVNSMKTTSRLKDRTRK